MSWKSGSIKRAKEMAERSKQIVDELKQDSELYPSSFYDLDPCCQKEIENNRRKNRIKEALRKTDRSYARYDLKAKICKDLRDFKLNNCHCCKSSLAEVDYPLLRDIRRDNLANSSVPLNEDNYNASNEDDDDESDDEYLKDIEIVSSYQSEAMRQFAEKKKLIDEYISLGYVQHTEDSVLHLEYFVNQGISVVCHVYDPYSQLDAHLTLQLEKLSQQYMGTLFRRIAMSSEIVQFIRSFKNASTSMVSSDNGWILVFVDKDLKCISKSDAFGQENDVFVSDLLNFLDKVKVLQLQPDYYKIIGDDSAVNIIDEEESDDDGRYCSDKYCSKKYPHEHVVAGKGATFAGAMGKDQAANEVLAENIFYRI